MIPAGRRLAGADSAPDWLQPLITATTSRAWPGALGGSDESTGTDNKARSSARSSAVLILFSAGMPTAGESGGGPDPDVLLTVRAATLSAHGGQPAFPGGRSEPGEDAVTTALREAQEETGLDPTSVTPVLQLQDLHLDFSRHVVSPVVAVWDRPGPVAPVDPGETAAVARIPVRQLVDPARRGRIRLSDGHLGPAFDVADMVIWGFTGILLDAVLEFGGWNLPWRPGRELRLARDDAAWAHVHGAESG